MPRSPRQIKQQNRNAPSRRALREGGLQAVGAARRGPERAPNDRATTRGCNLEAARIGRSRRDASNSSEPGRRAELASRVSSAHLLHWSRRAASGLR